MAESNPATVFVAENSKLAEAVIQLLAAQGIPAEVFTAPPRAVSEAITGVTELVTSDEFEIRVTDPAKVADANRFLASAMASAAMQAILQKRAQRTGTVTATCEECGKTSEWPATAMGTTETCPHCHAYLDVLDPEDDWSGVDFGSEEEENEKEEEKGEK
jgi:hypothetical protein